MLPSNRQVAYAASIEGPGLSSSVKYDSPQFPKNLPDVWDTEFGWLPAVTKRALVLTTVASTTSGPKDQDFDNALHGRSAQHHDDRAAAGYDRGW